jgi:transcriptional regulator with XRE-family HTH domain
MTRDANLRSARGLTRAQVAELLGVTDRDVVKMHGRQLHPAHASNRLWLYEPREVRALLTGRPAAAGNENTEPDGSVTAAAFALFGARKPLPAVVVELKVNASTALRLRAEYDEMRGSLLLPTGTVKQLRSVVGGDFRTPQELVAMLRDALEARFDDGWNEAQNCGAVVDPATGKLRPVAAHGPLPERAAEPPAAAPARDGTDQAAANSPLSAAPPVSSSEGGVS